MTIEGILYAIHQRISLAEADRREHLRCTRQIDALACEIRIQAFREAIAEVEGKSLPPNRLYQSGGVRRARRL